MYCQEDFAKALSEVYYLWHMAKRKNPHAVALGRRGGRKGGKARWEGVSSEERSKILRRAALARWRKKK